MNEIIIRPYASDDRFEVRRIAWETAFLGEPGGKFFSDQEILCDFLTLYFTDHEPESCFVAEYMDKVIGYLTGSVNERRLRRIFSTRIFSSLIIKSLTRGTFFRKKNFVFLIRCLVSSLIGEFDTPDFIEEYPAILHINLGKQFRSCGIGTKLMSAFFDYLVRLHVKGVHLTAMSKEAGIFFKKNGFELLYTGTRTYLWHVQKREVFMYWFGKKFVPLSKKNPDEMKLNQPEKKVGFTT